MEVRFSAIRQETTITSQSEHHLYHHHMRKTLMMKFCYCFYTFKSYKYSGGKQEKNTLSIKIPLKMMFLCSFLLVMLQLRRQGVTVKLVQY